MTDTIDLKEAREKVRKLVMEMGLQGNSDKEKALGEIEEILQYVLDNFNENIHAVSWVLVCSKTGSELEARATNVLHLLNPEKPFPGL